MKTLASARMETEALRNSAKVAELLPSKHRLSQSGPFRSVEQFEHSSFNSLAELVWLTDLTPNSQVLDWGCGLGRLSVALSQYLSPARGGYLGVDVDARCIARNKDAFRELPNFEFLHLDIYSKMYNRSGRPMKLLQESSLNRQFDLAILFSVFTHVVPAECDELLSFLREHLFPSGQMFSSWFLLNEISEAGISAGQAHREFAHELDGARIDNLDIPEGAVAYPEVALLARLRRAGFGNLQVIPGKWSGRTDSNVWQDIIIASA